MTNTDNTQGSRKVGRPGPVRHVGAEVFRADLGHGKTLHVSKGDLTAVETDAIVDPANEDLTAGGGLSAVLVSAGGDVIQRESNEWIKLNGKAGHKKPAVTSAGKLPARYIIHAVAPVWKGGAQGEPQDILDAYNSVLDKADELGLSSLAIPSLGTGVFKVPKPVGANAAMTAVKRFVAERPNSTVTDIHLVNNDDPTVEAMRTEAVRHFSTVT